MEIKNSKTVGRRVDCLRSPSFSCNEAVFPTASLQLHPHANNNSSNIFEKCFLFSLNRVTIGIAFCILYLLYFSLTTGPQFCPSGISEILYPAKLNNCKLIALNFICDSATV